MKQELDIEQREALVGYLRAGGRIGGDEAPVVRTLRGGVSNRTVLVERSNGEAWVIKQALPKLRVAVDWFSDPRRIEREAAGLRWLAKLAPPGTITPLLFEDAANHLLGMEAVPRPHENWKSMLLEGRVEADHVRQFAELLAAVHGRAWEMREALASIFDERCFFESLRVEPYYQYTAGQVAEAAGFLDELIGGMRGRRLTLAHGDYSPKNILVREGRLILLDHEVIHWGDPAFDAGFALTHLLSKAHHLPRFRKELAEAAVAFAEKYLGEVGRTEWARGLEGEVVRHTLGCMLARVAGRSPLEYLDAAERRRQREAVVGLMAEPPESVARLVGAFIERIENAGY